MSGRPRPVVRALYRRERALLARRLAVAGLGGGASLPFEASSGSGGGRLQRSRKRNARAAATRPARPPYATAARGRPTAPRKKLRRRLGSVRGPDVVRF